MKDATQIRNHLRCYGFFYRHHAPVHFLLGFFLAEMGGSPSFGMSLLGGLLTCFGSGLLNLLTYAWEVRRRPNGLASRHLRQVHHLASAKGRAAESDPALRRDLETLAQAPYLSAAQRERVQSLWTSVKTNPSTPLWQLRYQLEQLL